MDPGFDPAGLLRSYDVPYDATVHLWGCYIKIQWTCKELHLEYFPTHPHQPNSEKYRIYATDMDVLCVSALFWMYYM